MGSHDGAKECELGGIFILSHLTKLLKQNDVELYRDDSLIVVKSLNDQQTDKLRKIIIEIFKSFGLKIEIKTNLSEVSFLDVNFSLIKGTVKSYKKPNNNLSYINVSSNHPPNIIKRIPNSINDLPSRNFSSKEIFDNTKKDYQKALNKLGYKIKLLYSINSEEKNSINNRSKTKET